MLPIISEFRRVITSIQFDFQTTHGLAVVLLKIFKMSAYNRDGDSSQVSSLIDGPTFILWNLLVYRIFVCMLQSKSLIGEQSVGFSPPSMLRETLIDTFDEPVTKDDTPVVTVSQGSTSTSMVCFCKYCLLLIKLERI